MSKSATVPDGAQNWIANRVDAFETSGIRRVFELASKLEDPINLSIGQPDFDVPQPVKDAAIDAIQSGKNAYSPTQGVAPLRAALKERMVVPYGHADRELFVCSGTSGGLALAMLALVNPGDEVIYMDPYFVMYPPLMAMCGGVGVPVDAPESMQIDVDAIAAAITPRTKVIIVNSPGNPTGVLATEAQIQALAELAAQHNIALVSDEIYSHFVYDGDFVSPAKYNDQTIVIDGFSKSHSMTGWRVGYVHGPEVVVENMMKLQQYSFVCAPQPAQWAALTALDVDLSKEINDYAGKRDYLFTELSKSYDLSRPGGAFYLYPRAPNGVGGTDFVHRAIEEGLLIIPGKVFSRHDTHFRVSFAADERTLQRGAEVLRKLAAG